MPKSGEPNVTAVNYFDEVHAGLPNSPRPWPRCYPASLITETRTIFAGTKASISCSMCLRSR
jgi:hypothetical protein